MSNRPVLAWLPIFAEKLMSSPRYFTMPDYKQAWYLNLLFRSWLNSDNPGYLPNDPERLWMLANARTKQFFQREASEVLACFRVSADGRWLFNVKLLEVYERQLKEYLKRRPPPTGASISVSGLDVASERKKDKFCSRCEGSGKVASLSHPGLLVICSCMASLMC